MAGSCSYAKPIRFITPNHIYSSRFNVSRKSLVVATVLQTNNKVEIVHLATNGPNKHVNHFLELRAIYPTYTC